jgi:N-acetylglucosaminyldiphosphoundecaprenol N-acetyl-beta-D-mannosaminyltransferase
MSRKGMPILEAFIDALSWDDVIRQLVVWGATHESRYVCICNVHSVVTTTLDPELKILVNQADMSTPDGAPIAWALRKLGFPTQERINGPDLMWRYLVEAEKLGQAVFFYGSTETTLAKLRSSMLSRFPSLIVAGMLSPPYRSLSAAEDESDVKIINDSGANVLFVGLGCPMQEKWMAAHRGRINALMIGVGAAFDYHSGTTKRAPLWMQRKGLEWLYRLFTEPRRLYKRYFICNTLFAIGITKQFISNILARNANGTLTEIDDQRINLKNEKNPPFKLPP